MAGVDGAFSVAVLRAGGWPQTAANVEALNQWQLSEGGPADNPLNIGPFKIFGSQAAGALATANLIRGRLYIGIAAGLAAGDSKARTINAIIDSPWEERHYATSKIMVRLATDGSSTVSAPVNPALAGLTAALAPVEGATSPDLGVVPVVEVAGLFVPPRQVGEITLDDAEGKNVNVSRRVVGTPRFELSTSKTSQLTIALIDPNRELSATGILRPRGTGIWGSRGKIDAAAKAVGAALTSTAGAAVAIDATATASAAAASSASFPFEIAAVALGAADNVPLWTVTLRSQGVQKLRHDEGPGAMKGASATEYAAAAAKLVGLTLMGQGTARRGDIAPSKETGGYDKGGAESTWEVLTRLASEEGYALFEAGYVLYFAKPTWLVDRLPTVTVTVGTGNGRTDCIGLPAVRETTDDDTGAKLDIDLPRGRGEQVRPGMCVVMKWPKWIVGYASKFLVTDVTWMVDGGLTPVTITATEPIDPKMPATTDAAVAADAVGSDGIPNLLRNPNNPAPPPMSDVVARAVAFALKQLGKPYVWGANGPDSYDCTGLINAAYAAAGKTINSRPPRTIGAREVDAKTIQAGDIVSFGGLTHSALVISPTEMVEAPRTGIPVRRVPLRSGIVLVERVI